MIHYHIHQSPSPVQTLSQINPLHTFPPLFLKIHFLVLSHLLLGHLRRLGSWLVLTKLDWYRRAFPNYGCPAYEAFGYPCCA